MIGNLNNMCIVNINGIFIGFPMTEDGTLFNGEELTFENSSIEVDQHEISIGRFDLMDTKFYPSYKYALQDGTPVQELFEKQIFQEILKELLTTND